MLENLRDCVASNFHAQPQEPAITDNSISHTVPLLASPQSIQSHDEDEMFDPEDAESCDDMDEFFTQQADGPAVPPSAHNLWDFVSTLCFWQCHVLRWCFTALNALNTDVWLAAYHGVFHCVFR